MENSKKGLSVMSFTAVEQKDAAIAFVEKWSNKGDEKQDTHNFWHELLLTVYGVSNPSAVIEYEKRVQLGHTSYIDGYISSTKVLIEQKGSKIDLNKKEKQSDGEELTPYEQAFRYAGALPLSEKPRYIVTCNFRTFQIYDQNHDDPLNQDPLVINLEDLPKAFPSLDFLVDLKAKAKEAELDISVKAGSLIGKLYDSIVKQYDKNTSSDPLFLHNLNKLCVRLVFCLYAEDAFLFPKKNQFGDFLKTFSVENINTGLEKLFRILNTKESERSKLTDPKFLAFPYVNGGLFADHEYEIPAFSQESADILIKECSDEFDWSGISPTIFGAMFESTLNPETRRSGGMHYTSIENIHKVIDPLFLDDLKAEYQAIEDKIYKERQIADARGSRTRVSVLNEDRIKLEDLQKKIASLKFLDPACGSGNFLTETYLCLRRIENKILLILNGQQRDLFREINVQVSISNFYGIEINDFAVSVAKTALWIAESQTLEETNNLLGCSLQFLPLKSFDHIVEGNALRMDWNDVVPSSEVDYIMGNPPFVGYFVQSVSQKKDLTSIYVDEKGKNYKTSGKIDYVAGWFFLAAKFIFNTPIKVAFVATNSITQGEQVPGVWEPIFSRFDISINFAWKTFKWTSDSFDVATVHVVIIGFSCEKQQKKRIYEKDYITENIKNINPYLVDGDNVFIKARTKPICNVSEMLSGGKPVEGGFLILDEKEKEQLELEEPISKLYIKRLLGGNDFIKGLKRYCLWLVDCSPAVLKRMPKVLARVNEVRNYRLKSKKASTRKSADTPYLFQEVKYSSGDFLAIPEVSSEKRIYIPIGFFSKDTICTNAMRFVPNASLYDFGVITSIVHMAWTRVVTGRLEMRYNYSNTVVYNNFIWPDVTDEQKEKISKTAQSILDARALYPDSSLADLYDPLIMPIELRKAHKENDKVVISAYGWDKDISEQEIVSNLMELYSKATLED